MSKKKEEAKKLLSKYTKDQVIEAFLSATGTFYISDVLHKLWREKHDRLFKAMQEASNEDTKALQAYADFEKSLIKKYGKDGKCNLNAIPSQDFKKLRALAVAVETARKKCEKANKELDRFYKEEMQGDGEG